MKFSTERPVKETIKQPVVIKMIPGKNKSLNFTPPSPQTIAFGGVQLNNLKIAAYNRYKRRGGIELS